MMIGVEIDSVVHFFQLISIRSCTKTQIVIIFVYYGKLDYVDSFCTKGEPATGRERLIRTRLIQSST